MKRVTLNSETLAMMIVDYEGGMTLKQVSDKYNMAARTARRLLEEGGCTDYESCETAERKVWSEVDEDIEFV